MYLIDASGHGTPAALRFGGSQADRLLRDLSVSLQQAVDDQACSDEFLVIARKPIQGVAHAPQSRSAQQSEIETFGGVR